ncbi:FtsQ-type POTRA domain-containing protein [Streptomyces sp. NPDC052051]|uniref:cell division protein FtsQ/DivIB n=1 Tax=Streptomyces sp. NPDC052051 TaxID=3154649 RepID=UPI0034273C12
MAGPKAAERGVRQKQKSGPPRPPVPGRWARRRMLIILLLAVVLASGGVIWLLYGSSWLRVERVTVSGTRVLTPAQVRTAAGVRTGTPLASLDTDAIEARLRRKLPRVDTVEAIRSWPHGITLNVTERTPVLLLASGGRFVEVDREGVRFATVAHAPEGVPVLEWALPRAGGPRRFGTGRLLREAVRVAEAVPTAVARDTRTVKVRSYDSISLQLRGGRSVMWGSGEKGKAKAVTLAALMKAAPDARHFDVSVPTSPASSGS